MGFARKLLVLTAALSALVAPSVANAAPSYWAVSVSRLVTGLQGSVGSTVGPDGALYVPESAVGRITRVDPKTGALVRVNRDGTMTPIAANLDRPTSLEFIRDTAYVVTLGGDILKIDKWR